jgi:hypothetical protein
VATSQPITEAMTAMGMVSAAADPASSVAGKAPQRLRPGRARLVERLTDHSRERRPRPIFVQVHLDSLPHAAAPSRPLLARASSLLPRGVRRPHPEGLISKEGSRHDDS